MSGRSSADAVIVGAGIVGCAAAYMLADRGLQVVVVEKGDVGGAVSGASLACIGTHMIDRDELPLLTRSCELWRNLEQTLGVSIEYNPCGQLRFIASEDDLPIAQSWVEEECAHGLAVELIDGAGVRELVPALKADIVGATWSSNDATVNPFLSCRALIAAAQERGAQVLTHTEVNGIDVRDHAVQAVRAGSEQIATRLVVNAGGPWARHIAQMAGVDVPIRPRKAQCLATESVPSMIPCVVGACESAGGVEAGYTQIQQAPTGQVLFNTVLGGGLRAEGQQDVESFLDHKFMMDSIHTLLWLFPDLRHVNLLRSWVRYEAVTPDDRFLIGTLPGVAGLLMAAGDAGTGFVRAPIIGRLIAELAGGETPSHAIARYAPARFAVAP